MKHRLIPILLLAVLLLPLPRPLAAETAFLAFRQEPLLDAVKADPALDGFFRGLIDRFRRETGLAARVPLTLLRHRGAMALLIHGTLCPPSSWQAEAATDRFRRSGWLLARQDKDWLLCRPADEPLLIEGLSGRTIPDHTPGLHLYADPAGLDWLLPPGYLERLPDTVREIQGHFRRSEINLQLEVAAADRDGLGQWLKERIRESFARADEVNRTDGFNFWSRNAAHFLRSLSLKTQKKGLRLSALTIQSSEELAARRLLPGLLAFLRAMEDEETRRCRQERDRLALHLFEALLRGETQESARQSAHRAGLIPTDGPQEAGGPADPDVTASAFPRCTVHDGR